MLSNSVDKLQYLVENGTGKQKKILFSAVLLPSIILRLYHILFYPLSYGYDSSWHLAYILKLASKWTLPSAYENLEAYQPPLYYFISACFTAIIGIENHVAVKICLKLINSGYGFIMLFFIYKTLSLASKTFFHNNKLIVLCGTILSFYLPAHIYISPMVSNEMLCACLITIGLYLITYSVTQKNFSTKQAFLLGITIGLALLTKYTGILLFLSFIIVWAILFCDKTINRRKLSVFIVIVVSLVLIISGWWYIRNAVKYGDPLIKSNDMKKFNNVYNQQPPGSHSLKNFLVFDFRVFRQPFLAVNGQTEKFWSNYKKNHFLIYYNDVYNSIITGTFSTIWVENHGLFLNTNRGCLWLTRFLLIPGFLIFVLSIAGFYKITARLFNKLNYSGLSPMVVLVIISLAAYISYNIKYPYFCHVKAFLMLHLSCPFVLSFCYGLNILLKKSKFLFNFFIICLCFIIVLVTSIYGFFVF